ncbi:MAG: RHS repeat-associated core domain-containing protein [Candidatus Contendobacter sp.]|nr:RHS repeat-associated core domain-containing protein [Candidatus Contendobacter sp.]MDS4059812.1 RHS repeat-associated core domain-containing protein [Candidatus Contendobacter sp.]
MTNNLRPVLRIVGLLLLVLAGVLTGSARADTITYFHNDPSGSPVAATDQNGRLLWKETYRPYGERLLNGASADANRLWFTGKPQDPDTGLSYLGARYYSPPLGRFMGIDPKAVDPGDPHSFNRYTYANNNPYKFVDPDGSHPILVALTYFALRYAVVYSEELLVAAIVAAEVAGGAPTPLSAGTSAVASEVRAIKGAEAGAEVVAKRAPHEIADEIRNAGHAIAANRRTIAVGEDAAGNLHVGSSNGLDRGMREAAEQLGVKQVPSQPGLHAEEELMDAISDLRRVGTSRRSPCGPGEHNCAQQLLDRGIEVTNP